MFDKGKRSRTFSPQFTKKIFERDKGTCVYCGAPAAEIDHVIPYREGGKGISSNCVCTCRSCNQAKKNHPNDDIYLTRAIFWLLQCGENISWMDEFYK